MLNMHVKYQEPNSYVKGFHGTSKNAIFCGTSEAGLNAATKNSYYIHSIIMVIYDFLFVVLVYFIFKAVSAYFVIPLAPNQHT